MKFVFHLREPFEKQLVLAQALIKGASTHGDEIYLVHGFEQVHDVDGLVMLGIGGLGLDHARIPFDAYKAAGKHVVFFDKGYTRNDYFRVAVDAFQPTEYLMQEAYPTKRFRDMGLTLPKHSMANRKVILFDGASEKYCAWHGFGSWYQWGVQVVEKIRRHTQLPIVYRPRPGRNAHLEIDGVETSVNNSIQNDLARAYVVVSWGGNIGWDAVMSGTPHFAMGDSIARHVSETDWDRLDIPRLLKPNDVMTWAANVVHCQYSLPECENGMAWGYVKEVIGRQAHAYIQS